MAEAVQVANPPLDLSKETLAKKLLPSLLRTRDGKNVLDGVQAHLDAQNLSHSQIGKRFDSAKTVTSSDFWTFFVDIFNNSFSCKVTFKEKDGEVADLPGLLFEMMRIRFDRIFEEKDYRKIESQDVVDKFLASACSKESAIDIVAEDGIRRLVVPFKRTYDENVEPNQPGSRTAYPNLLLRVEGDRISFDCRSKQRISATIQSIETKKESEDQTVLSEYAFENLDNLKVDVKNFFTNLTNESFHIKQIKFDNKLFYFSTGSKTPIDYDKLIDREYYLNTILDFISIKSLKLEYTEEIDGKNRDFTVSIKTEIQNSSVERSRLKFILNINKSKYLTDGVKNNIKKRLGRIGIKFDNAYDLPLEYYLNLLLYDSPTLGAVYSKILEIDSENKIIQSLKDKSILTTDPKLGLDEGKLHAFIVEKLKDITGESMLGNESMKILDPQVDSKGRMCLDVKLSNDAHGTNDYYSVLLNDKAGAYDKILKVIVYNFDKAYVLRNLIEGNDEKVLEYIHMRVKSYLQYEYGIQLGKEASRAHRWLVMYSEKFKELEKEEDAKKLGDRVERELNILMKYLFRNFKPLGGAKKPDGYLYAEQGNLLLDSKQHRDVRIGEIDKVARYLFTYCTANGLPEAKHGVLIVCRGKIGKSLNKTAVEEWQKSDYFKDYVISFITLEFILGLFDKVQHAKANGSWKIRKDALEKFHHMVGQTKTLSESAKVAELEDKTLKELSAIIEESVHIPKRDREL